MNKQQAEKSKVTKSSPTSYRPDEDLVEPIQNWLALNKGMKLSTLLNLAVRDFITKSHTLEAVEISEPSEGQFTDALDRVMTKHRAALSELADYDKSIHSANKSGDS